jgi:two-component system phosphate regulon response regulator PhoB
MSAAQQPLRLLLLELELDPGPPQRMGQALAAGGFAVQACSELAAMQQQLSQNTSRWNLVIVRGDPASPAVLALCAERRSGAQPVPLLVLGSANLALTAGSNSGEACRDLALEAGADDVLLHPFTLPECLARCRALVRRHQGAKPMANVLRLGPIEMVVDTRQVRLDGTPVALSPRECQLLQFLLAHPGQIWHREELLSRVWGAEVALDLDPKTVDVHIHWLRLKLEANPAQPSLITTVRGKGYRLG